MDEEIQIINTNTRIEKIKNFFISKRKTIITTTLVIILLLISFFGYLEFKDRKKAQLANKFNLIAIIASFILSLLAFVYYDSESY